MKNLILISVTFLIAHGCSPKKGTSTGNPDAAQVEMQIQSTKPGALSGAALSTTVNIDVTNAAGANIGTLTLTRGELALRDIEITTQSELSGGDREIDLEGPFVVDLLTNTVSPSLSSLSLPAGNYDEIALKLHKIDGSESGSGVSPSDPLFGNSIAISGTYTGLVSNGIGGTTSVMDAPFRMSFDFNEEFNLGSSNGLGFELSANQTNTLIIAFRLSKWFKFSNTETNSDGVDFEDIEPNGSGEITFDNSSSGQSAKVRSVIKENIKESADFGKDYNGNGELEKEEDDDPDSEDGDDD